MEQGFSERYAAFYFSVSAFISSNYIFIIAISIGFGTIFFTILINHSVRMRRIKLIHGFTSTFNPERRKRCPDQDLLKTAELPAQQGEKRIIRSPRKDADIRYSPSLEFVVSKYITDLDEGVSVEEFARLKDFVKFDDERLAAPYTALRKGKDSPLEYMLHGISCFSLPVNVRMLFNAIPTMVVVAAGWYMILEAFRVLAHHYWIHPIESGARVDAAGTKECFSHLVPLAVVFFSSYVASIKILVRAVSLFDLTAITFLRVFLHIVGSMLAGYVIWAAVSESLDCHSKYPYIMYPLFFVIGFIPDGGVNTLLSHASTAAQQPKVKTGFWGNFYSFFSTITQFVKQTDGRFAGVTKSTPLEVIDGIDFFTRYRLEEAGIYEVQNLATANPILLHVETPFGIYQVIDWVGQAQLCTVVGLERFLIFRQFNVRTVFDLERAVLSLKATSQIRRIIGGILLMPTNVLTDIGQLSDTGGRFPNIDNLGRGAEGPKAEAPKDTKASPANEPTEANAMSTSPTQAGKVAEEAGTGKKPKEFGREEVKSADDGTPKDSDRRLPDERRPKTHHGYLTALDYCRWSAVEALKPSTYRVTLPEKRKEEDRNAARDCSISYRVFPVDLPANLTPYAKFELVEGCKHEILNIHEVKNEEDATIKHAVRLIMDDLHVMRLRQIWESIARILGPDAATLDDSEDTFLGA